MNKNAKYGLIILTIIVLAVVISLVYLKNNQKNNPQNAEPLTSEESASTDNQPAPIATTSVTLTAEQAAKQAKQLAVSATAAVGTPVPATATPVYTKTIKVEYMKTAEKTKLGIPAELKVQVLDRNSEGTVLAYKIIRQDSDIVTKFGN